MSIRETVKQALTAMRGNKRFTVVHLAADPRVAEFEPEQIRRALRDISYVKRIDEGYIVKGRRVPNTAAPRLKKIVKCVSCHKFATRNSRIDQELGICGRCAQNIDRKAERMRQHYAKLAHQPMKEVA